MMRPHTVLQWREIFWNCPEGVEGGRRDGSRACRAACRLPARAKKTTPRARGRFSGFGGVWVPRFDRGTMKGLTWA